VDATVGALRVLEAVFVGTVTVVPQAVVASDVLFLVCLHLGAIAVLAHVGGGGCWRFVHVLLLAGRQVD